MSPTEPMPLWKRRVYFYTMVFVFVLIVPIIALYTAGYRLGDGLHIVQTGGIHVYAPFSGAVMSVEQRQKEAGTFQKDWFIQNLTPGTYTVSVAKDGFWTWSKNVEVMERHVTEASAFLVPKDPKKTEIPSHTLRPPQTRNGATTTEPNPRYQELQSAFSRAKRTLENIQNADVSTTSPLSEQYDQISSRGRVALWEEHNQLFATWLENKKDIPPYFCRGEVCEKTVVVYFSFSPITYFDFFPGREDVALVATQRSIFAIEIDERGKRNIQPVYKGENPMFIVKDGMLFVKDSGNIFEISLS